VLNAVFRSENNEEATPATTLLPDEMRPGDFFEARVVPAVLLEQVVHHCKRWGEQDAKKAQGGGKVVKLDTKRQTG
jgi:hypothetical protein